VLPFLKHIPEVRDEVRERRVRRSSFVKVKCRSNRFGIFNPPEARKYTRFPNGLNKKKLVAIAVTLLIRRITPEANYVLERCGINHEPALNMWVRYCTYGAGGNPIRELGYLISTLRVPHTVPIRCNDNQVRKGALTLLEVSQELLQLAHNGAMPVAR